MTNTSFENMVKEKIYRSIVTFLPSLNLELSNVTEAINELIRRVLVTAETDRQAMCSRDPAMKVTKRAHLISQSFHAVLTYRIAHEVYYYLADIFPNMKSELRDGALEISEECKCKTQIEIHPGAVIGDSFVLDHGVGTVIGETTVIGKRCYMLQGVVLGACRVADNLVGQRHPKIGNNVEISSFVKIFGNVKVGDNAFLGPRCVVTFDVPEDSNITLATQLQIQKNKEKYSAEIYGIVPEHSNLIVYGYFPKNLEIVILNEAYLNVSNLNLRLIEVHANCLKIEICEYTCAQIMENGYFLGLIDKGGIIAVIRNSIGLKRYLENRVFSLVARQSSFVYTT